MPQLSARKKRAHRLHKFPTDSEVLHQCRPERNCQHKNRRKREGKKQSVDQRVSRIVQIFPAIGVRDEGIESQQQAGAENGDAVI